MYCSFRRAGARAERERERAFVMRWVLCARESGGVNELRAYRYIYIRRKTISDCMGCDKIKTIFRCL